MKAPAWLKFRAAFAGLLTLVVLTGPCGSRPAMAAPGVEPLGRTVALREAHFSELLVATAPTTPEENGALVAAAIAYEKRTDPEDVGSLLLFLADHPRSGWAPAVLTNLGLSYLHGGYFSQAIEAWTAAWTQGKDATDFYARAMVDRAVGELARLDASLGHVEALTALFEEIGPRPITGSATEAVQTAREMLVLAAKDPRHLFICGPTALRSLLLALGASYDKVDFLQWYRAGPDGTNLAEVAHLANQAKLSYRLIFRRPGEPVPPRAVVHWKVGHFAAITGEENGRFHIDDPVFPGQGVWVTQAALDKEASGYFLVPADTPVATVWRTVDVAEADEVWGKGPTSTTQPGDAGDPPANPANGCPLCGYNIKESTVGVTLSDTPVGYVPPIGPSTKVRITYNQREDSQPQNLNFFNVGPKWTLNWLSYVTDDPTQPGVTVSRYLSGGGAYYYSGYNALTGQFAAQTTDGSVLVLATRSPATYRRNLSDGSVEIYAQANGGTQYPRNIFLSQVIDPQGNALTLNYDTQMRLRSLTDAVGRQTTFAYDTTQRITRITDPFGRYATLTYDDNGRLSSITDVIGLTSAFGYDANSLVNTLTTPYGTTTFAYTAPGASSPPRFVQVTDPLGYHEREEWVEPAPQVADSDPAATVPQGMSLQNSNLQYRDSFHWDKNAYVVAGCTPTGGCDYTKARDRHFMHLAFAPVSTKSTGIESVKYPLENRIWYSYPGQVAANATGTYQRPTAMGRVLDDGTTQLSQFSYDAGNFFKLTQAIDPVGRKTSFAYANGVDLAAVAQQTAYGTQTTIAQFTYNTQHRPILYTDAAGQMTRFAYNAAGQLTSRTNALNQTTSFQYNGTGDLTTIVNANNATAASFTYDSADRVLTYTDSEGWTATYSYDNADRVTKVTYPDGTADQYTYDKLDRASYRDRLGRLWTYAHDANRRMTAMTDPSGNQTLYAYNGINKLTSLTDAKGYVTSWTYDVEGRVTSRKYADNSTVTYAYENTTSRLKSVTDALGQVKQYGYFADNRRASVTYANAVNPTPNVSFAWDPYYPRLVSRTDGVGTAQYGYVPVGTLGALGVQQANIPLPNGASITITSAYDALGRSSSRTVAGAGAQTFQYDAIGRLTGDTSDLGAFMLSYLGQTRQITQRALTGTTLATAWSYLPNSGDRRLASIANTGLSTSQTSTYSYTTTPESFISGVSETSDTPSVYPAAATQTASYNNLNQLTSLSGQALSYDANGNLLSDGQRSYSWDAENRLVKITYPSQSGKQTAFTYDGLGHRMAISSTPAGGGSTATTSYLWCGSRMCQARSSTNAVTRAYYAEGEYVAGSPAQPRYYGQDQLGSVRRAFISNSSAPAYAYDAYGNALQSTAPTTDFTYAGLFYNVDSGLSLANYRAYDPNAGRWISRDPLGERVNSGSNVYIYSNNSPTNARDILGLWTLQLGLAGGMNVFGFPLQGGFGVAFDTQGGVAVYAYGGGGIGAGLSEGFGGTVQVSNAQTVSDLSDRFNNGSVTLGVGVGASVDYFNGTGQNGESISGGGITLGQAAGASASATQTWTQLCTLSGQCYGPLMPDGTPSPPTSDLAQPESLQPPNQQSDSTNTQQSDSTNTQTSNDEPASNNTEQQCN